MVDLLLLIKVMDMALLPRLAMTEPARLPDPKQPGIGHDPELDPPPTVPPDDAPAESPTAPRPPAPPVPPVAPTTPA